ncbi:MAG: DUF3131 domain-containing protein [Candidatus Bathyarchaeia archaeon]|jgi:hypothetical protein
MNTQRTFTKAVVIILISVLTVCLIAGLGLNFSGAQVNASDDSSSFWLSLAENAWNYFQPGIGVDSTTGLPLASVGGPVFTDWDTGLYIQAIIDAEKLGILSSGGVWGADDRINRVLTFLENRPLMADGLPYLYYSSQTGENQDDSVQVATDAGNLFVALNNLKDYRPDLASLIDYIVYNRTNYEPREESVDILLGEMLKGTRVPNIYDYYVTCGFADFWPERFSAEANAILNFIVSSPTVNYSGVVLPEAKLTSEPLLLYIFNFQQPNATMLNLTRQVYLAQEMRYNLTGKYTAFSEGNTDSGLYVYEWVVLPDGRMWVLQTGDSNDVNTDVVGVTPIVYLKAAVGFLAIYDTPYTQNMVSYILGRVPAPSSGYNDGVDETGQVVAASLGVGNSLIISAARYAVDNNVSVPFSCPMPSPSSTPIVDDSAPVISPAPTVAPTPVIVPSPTITPSPSVAPKIDLSSLSISTSMQNKIYIIISVSTVAFAIAVFADALVYKKRKTAKSK